MKFRNFAKSQLVTLITAFGVCFGVNAASAAVLDIAGAVGGHSFTGQLDLNIVGGQAVNGGGRLTILGLSNAPLVLITTTTPGNENNSPSAPVGFRANDGTDYFDYDTASPISTNGLLFDVGTTTAAFGAYPLFGIYDNGGGSLGASFTGSVGGNEYYNLTGSATAVLSSVPLPASAPLFGAALLGLGVIGYGMKRKTKGQSLAAGVSA